MKLFAAALVAATASASGFETYIPYDCYHESARVYGTRTDKKVSDMDIMTGLDAYAHRVSGITACLDLETNLISGVTTTFGKINEADLTYTDVKRLNLLGNMSGLYHYDDNAVIGSITSLSDA